MDLKRRIGIIAVALVSTLGIGHMVLAATDIVASNSCEDCESDTGDANSQNNAATTVGQFGGPNSQDGDNEAEVEQDANSQSGDSVNGQVVGAVDGGGAGGTGGGSTDINASNSCEDCESDTGDANSQNNAATTVGQFGGPNSQDGDNEAEVEQDANSQSGDSVNGQVIGSSS